MKESDRDYRERICALLPEGHVHTAEELGDASGEELDAIGSVYNCPRNNG